MSANKYDRQQFEKYLKGKMSNEEAHTFESEVLKDPFAQEALEGLENQTAESVLADLKKLQVRTNPVKKVRFSLMQIAAAVSLIMVSSLAVWLLMDPLTKEDPIAMESEVVEEKSDQPEMPQEKANFAQEDSLAEEQIIQNVPEVVSNEKKEAIKEVDQTPVLTAEIPEPTNDTDADAGDQILAEVVIEDIVMEEEINTQGASAFADEDLTLALQTDDEEDKEVEVSKISDAEVVVSRASAPVEAITPKKTEPLAKNDQANKTPATSKMARARSLSGNQIQKSTDVRTAATPESGQAEFQKYLRENLRYPQAAIDNGIKGTVILELTVSPSGEITHIDVKKSLGYGCDQEAMRLVNEGPKWNPATRNGISEEEKIRIRVRFRN